MNLSANSASSVTANSAVLTVECTATKDGVSVNPTSVGFRYGTSTSLGTTKTCTLSNGTFTTTLTGLSANTRYYWNAFAVVEDKEYLLTDTHRYFTTKEEEAVVSVTSVSYTDPDLSDGYAPTSERAYLSAKYTATKGGANVAPTAVGFCYGTSTTKDEATTVTVDKANLDAGSGSFYLWQYGLQPDTKYYWWAWVTVDGKTTYSDRKQFTTKAAANTAPALGKSWLEMPAVLTGTAMENATVWTVYNGSTRNYTIAYDTSKYTTYWVAYNLKASHMGSLARPTKWTYDESTGAPATSMQVNVDNTYATYNNGDGHAKGHMIPNASRNGNATMQTQTFQYPNSVPQWHNGFNSGIWSSLEAAVQGIAEGEEIFVVTGTAFNKGTTTKAISYTSTPSDSGKKVPIPNYFYKVVLKVNSTSNSAKAIGFWFENKAYSSADYTKYAVSVDQIEEWTGMNFFVNLSDTIEESAESNSSWTTFSNF